jgi:hypothetical protein
MLFKRIVTRYRRRFMVALSSELSPSKVALTFALAIPIGIVPFFCCFNILLGFLIAWKFKLNHLLVQLIGNVVYPLQIMLFLPFMQLGVSWFSTDSVPFSAKIIMASFSESMLGTIQMLGLWNLYALLAWLLMSAPFACLIYYLSMPIAKRKVRVKPVAVEAEYHRVGTGSN